MSSTTLKKSGLAAAAASALVAIAMPLVGFTSTAAPTAAPPSDGSGYVDSTARCTKPDTAVLFGTTASSRIAICKTASGFEYRGVRVSDGAKLIAAAKQTSDTTFVASNDGVTYTVTPTALSVTAGGDTFRTETWSDFHGPQAPASSSASASGSSATSATSKPSTSASKSSSAPTSASATPGLATSAAAKPSASSQVPLPPPMAAEVGGGSSSAG